MSRKNKSKQSTRESRRRKGQRKKERQQSADNQFAIEKLHLDAEGLAHKGDYCRRQGAEMRAMEFYAIAMGKGLRAADLAADTSFSQKFFFKSAARLAVKMGNIDKARELYMAAGLGDQELLKKLAVPALEGII